MKTPGFFWCLVAAFAGALLVKATMLVIWPLIGGQAVMRLLVAVLPLLYALFLLGFSRGGGRIVLGVLAAGVTATGWILPMDLPVLLAVQGLMVWIVRAASFHRSVVGALMDGGLAFLGLMIGAGVLAGSGGLATAVWAALLSQTAFVFIPDTFGAVHPGRNAATEESRFDRAHRAAEAALRTLV